MGHVRKINGREVTEAEFRASLVPGRLAEMLREGRAPRAVTDREFLAGHCNGSQFAGREEEGDFYQQVAEQHGQDTTGKVYLSGLARFPGDPHAWVAGKGDVERVLDQHGWGSEGLVKRAVKNVAEPAKVVIDPQLIEDEVNAVCAEIGEPHIDRLDLAEQVYQKRGGIYADSQAFEPERDCPQILAEEMGDA